MVVFHGDEVQQRKPTTLFSFPSSAHILIDTQGKNIQFIPCLLTSRILFLGFESMFSITCRVQILQRSKAATVLHKITYYSESAQLNFPFQRDRRSVTNHGGSTWTPWELRQPFTGQHLPQRMS